MDSCNVGCLRLSWIGGWRCKVGIDVQKVASEKVIPPYLGYRWAVQSVRDTRTPFDELSFINIISALFDRRSLPTNHRPDPCWHPTLRGRFPRQVGFAG